MLLFSTAATFPSSYPYFHIGFVDIVIFITFHTEAYVSCDKMKWNGILSFLIAWKVLSMWFIVRRIIAYYFE